MKRKPVEKNSTKTLITLYKDFLSILLSASISSNLNTLSKILIGVDRDAIHWVRILKGIDKNIDELCYYKDNLFGTSSSNEKISLEKLIKYKKITVSSLNTIRRNATYSDSQTSKIFYQAVNKFKEVYNLLQELITENLKNTNIGQQLPSVMNNLKGD